MLNPDDFIRPWLIGCGHSLGVHEAHPYRWPDAATRYEVGYFTYRALSGVPVKERSEIINEAKSGDYDSIAWYMQAWIVQYQIDLYNLESGLYDLGGICAAAGKEQAYIDLFKRNGTAWHSAELIEDLTNYDDAEIKYHHKLICKFEMQMLHKHEARTNVITSAEFTLKVEE